MKSSYSGTRPPHLKSQGVRVRDRDCEDERLAPTRSGIFPGLNDEPIAVGVIELTQHIRREICLLRSPDFPVRHLDGDPRIEGGDVRARKDPIADKLEDGHLVDEVSKARLKALLGACA